MIDRKEYPFAEIPQIQRAVECDRERLSRPIRPQ
jgi:hypothetical protein